MKFLAVLLLGLLAVVSAAPFRGLDLDQQTPLALNSFEFSKEVSIQSISQCKKNSADDLLTIKDLKIVPDPPQRGKRLDIVLSGTLKKTLLPGSTIHVLVKLGPYIQLIKKDIDLCENSGKVGITCPINEGEQDLKAGLDLPDAIPAGTYFITADITDQENKPVTCVQAQIKFT